MLTTGKIVLADLAGDKAILKAMKTNEDDTVNAYQNALDNDDVPGDLTTFCNKALDDEKRHRAYMEEQSR